MNDEEKKEGRENDSPSLQKKPEGFFSPHQQKKPENHWNAAQETADIPKEDVEKDDSPSIEQEPAQDQGTGSAPEATPQPPQPSYEPKPWETFAAKQAQSSSQQSLSGVQPNSAPQQPNFPGQPTGARPEYRPQGPGEYSAGQGSAPRQPGAYPPPYAGQQHPYQAPGAYPGGNGPWQGYSPNGHGGAWQPPQGPQHSQQGQPGYPQQPPYGQPPYSGQPPYPPYTNGYPPYAPKPPKSRGFKVFMGILIAALVIFVIGLFVSSIWSAFNMPAEPSTSNSEMLPPDGNQQPEEQQPELPEPSGNATPAPSGNVTNPNSSGITLQAKPQGNGLEATEVYEKVAPSIVCVLTQTQMYSGIGSGIIATEDGYIFTNSHVINDSLDVSVTVLLHDGNQYEAAIVGFDKITDLAVLKIDASGLTPAEFGNSDDLIVGETVYAIGNPSSVQYASSMTNGIVSGLNRPVSYSNSDNMTYIQTNAAISPGNSGGALVNAYGQVVGITSSKISGVSYEGLNFAIPTARAKTILDDLMTSGYVSGRPRLGITGRDAYAVYGGTGGGVEIASIENESPLSGQAQIGDIIIAVDGESLSTMDELFQILGTHSPGDQLTLTLFRNGQQFDITITLLEDRGEIQTTPQQPTMQ